VIKIFLSYASIDDQRGGITRFLRDFRAELTAEMPNVAVEVFKAPHGIKPGADWENDLGEQIDTCDFYIPLFSPSFFDSPWCAWEWGYFQERVLRSVGPDTRGLPDRLLPVCWRPLGGGLHPVVQPIQLPTGQQTWSETRGLIDWQEEPESGNYSRLVRGLARHIKEEAGARRGGRVRALTRLHKRLSDAEPAFLVDWAFHDVWECNLVHVLPDAALCATGAAPTSAEWDPFGVRGRSSSLTRWDVETGYPGRVVETVLRRSNIVPDRPPLHPPNAWGRRKRAKMRATRSPTVVLCAAAELGDEDTKGWLGRVLDAEDVAGRIVMSPVDALPELELPSNAANLRLLEEIPDARRLASRLQDYLNELWNERLNEDDADDASPSLTANPRR
jgi:hypothetical protein